jgi:hypothetical protein
MRSNKRQHSAQTLRFEPPAKNGNTAHSGRDGLRTPDMVGRSDTGLEGAKTVVGRKSCIQDLPGFDRSRRGSFMTETIVKLRLNQQQLELMDRTIAQGLAADRETLVRLALREYAAARKAEAAK